MAGTVSNMEALSIFGYELPYCIDCIKSHQKNPKLAIRAEDDKHNPLGYNKNNTPIKCWEHTTDEAEKQTILGCILQRLKDIANSEVVSNINPISLLVGIEFNRFVSDSHKHLQKLRLHLPNALIVQVSLQNVEANSAVLSGTTLYQCNIKGAAFQNGFFREANIIDTDAVAVDLYKTCFEGALIACSRFDHSMFERSDLTKSNVIATSFEKSNFGLSNLTGSRFCEVFCEEMVDALLEYIKRPTNGLESLSKILHNLDLLRYSSIETTFEKCRFSSADLSGVNFKHICMNDSDFNDADLSGVAFNKCVLSNSTFRRAQVRHKGKRSVFRNCQAQNCDFSGASLDRTKFLGESASTTSLMSCNFDTASLCHAEFTGSKNTMLDMRRVNLNNSNLEGSLFSFVNLDGADMTGGISLNKVSFLPATDSKKGIFVGSLKGVNLQGADMDSACFSCCDFSGALMQGISAVKSNLSKASLIGASLRGSDLRGICLAEANCKATNFEAATLTHEKDSQFRANLDNCDFSGATLTDCDLRYLVFNGTNLKKCKMNGVDLTSAIFKSGASLESAELANTDFTKAELIDIKLNYANLSYALLDKAKLQGCKATRAQFNAASMRGVNLRGANVEGADFTAAVLYPAKDGTVSDLSQIEAANSSFKFANLEGANLRHGHFFNVNFEGANLVNSNLNSATINDAIFQNSLLDNANLTNCSAERVVFSGASLTGVDLSESNIRNSDFKASVLSPSSSKNSKLRDVKAEGASFVASILESAELRGGNFAGASFAGADLRNTNLTFAKFLACDLSNATMENANVTGTKMISCHANFSNLSNFKQDISKNDILVSDPYYKYWAKFCPKPHQQSQQPEKHCMKQCEIFCMVFSSFEDSNFNNSDLRLANLYGSGLEGSSFIDAQLKATYLEHANLSNAIISTNNNNERKHDKDKKFPEWSMALLKNAILNNTHIDESEINQKDISAELIKVYGNDDMSISDVWRALKVNLTSLGLYELASKAYIAEKTSQHTYYKKYSCSITVHLLISYLAVFVFSPVIRYISILLSPLFPEVLKYLSAITPFEYCVCAILLVLYVFYMEYSIKISEVKAGTNEIENI